MTAMASLLRTSQVLIYFFVLQPSKVMKHFYKWVLSNEVRMCIRAWVARFFLLLTDHFSSSAWFLSWMVA
jgi:hypothetical protein